MEINFLTRDSWIFAWVVLPILIILARIADQSIGTLRLIFLAKGYKILAPLLGFFEVIIWLLAVTQILRHLDNAITYIAYGLGFALGNYIGIVIEQKLSLGNVIVRIIPRYDTSELIKYLRENNYGLTTIDAMGSQGQVKIIFSVIKRRDLDDFVAIINRYNPNAFYTIEDVKTVHEGILDRRGQNSLLGSLWIGNRKFK